MKTQSQATDLPKETLLGTRNLDCLQNAYRPKGCTLIIQMRTSDLKAMSAYCLTCIMNIPPLDLLKYFLLPTTFLKPFLPSLPLSHGGSSLTSSRERSPTTSILNACSSFRAHWLTNHPNTKNHCYHLLSTYCVPGALHVHNLLLIFTPIL